MAEAPTQMTPSHVMIPLSLFEKMASVYYGARAIAASSPEPAPLPPPPAPTPTPMPKQTLLEEKSLFDNPESLPTSPVRTMMSGLGALQPRGAASGAPGPLAPKKG